MPKKRHAPEEIVAKLRQVDVPTSQGRPLGERRQAARHPRAERNHPGRRRRGDPCRLRASRLT
jgi:hypothetical protein